jgi:MFS family permease
MSFRAAVIVLVLGLGQLTALSSSFYLMGVLGDPIGRDLGLGPGFTFGLMSLALLISAIGAPFGGRWLDATGGKPVLLASSLVFGTGLGLMALARGPVLLTAGMAVIGAGMAIGMYGTAFKILVGLHGEGARGPITAVALLGGLGGALGWPLTLWMEEQLGWRGACLGWAGLNLLVCLPLAAWVLPGGSTEAGEAGPTTKGEAGAGSAVIVWDRRMVQVAALFAGAWWLSAAMSAHLPRLLEAVGLSRDRAVAMAALSGAAAAGVRLAEILLLRRLPPMITTRIATLMHPLGAGTLLAFGPRAAAALSLGQGAGNGMLSVAAGVLPLSLFGARGYGLRSALMLTPARFLQAAGPTVFALALARSPAVALAVTCGVCGVMFAMTFGLKREGGLRRTE